MLGGTTLGVIAWADDAHETAVARTMGMTTFAIANVFFSFAVKDDLRSIFSLDAFADRRLLKATAMSVIAIVFGTELGIFQRILGTVSLTRQRVDRSASSPRSTIIVASEIQKLFRRRSLADDRREAEEEGAAATGAGSRPRRRRVGSRSRPLDRCNEIEWQLEAQDLRPVLRWIELVVDGAAGITVTAGRTVNQVDTYVDTADRRLERAGTRCGCGGREVGRPRRR